MSLSEWQKNGWLKRHPADRAEIAGKLRVVERDLRVSGEKNMDSDWRFAAGYNAALQISAVALLACGYEANKGGGAHHYTIESLKLTIGAESALVDSLQAFRGKRGGAVYETVGISSETEIEELRDLAVELRDRVIAWLKTHHKKML